VTIRNMIAILILPQHGIAFTLRHYYIVYMNELIDSDKKRIYPIALAILSAALFGAAAPFSKILLNSVGTFHLAGLLYLGASLGIAPIAIRDGNLFRLGRLNGNNRLRLAGAIIFGGILAPVFLLLGLKAASASSVSIWLPSELVATAILGRLFFDEHLGLIGSFGLIGVIVAGILLGIGESNAGLKAGLFVALACFCWGFDNNFTALIDDISPSQITFWKGLGAGLVNLLLGVAANGFDIAPRIMGLSLMVGMLFYGVSIMLYITAAQSIGPTRGQTFFASAPFFGVIISVIVLKESFGATQLIATLLILASLALVFFDKHGHLHSHAAMVHLHSHRHDDGHHDHIHVDIDPNMRHSHEHQHEAAEHSHPHLPDIQHRHDH
jgi:drug/metabolite transporter (DMT)-like permease